MFWGGLLGPHWGIPSSPLSCPLCPCSWYQCDGSRATGATYPAPAITKKQFLPAGSNPGQHNHGKKKKQTREQNSSNKNREDKSMPNFCLQCDLRINNGNVNGFPRQRVYYSIDCYLIQRGFQRYQHSCWRREGVTTALFHLQAVGLATHIEGLFGANSFRSIHYERRFNLIRVR